MELISPEVRFAFRELCVSLYKAQIDFAFRSAGITTSETREMVHGERRYRVEEYYASIDWFDPTHLARFIRAVNYVLARDNLEEARIDRFLEVCRRDGLIVDNRQVAFGVMVGPSWLLSASAPFDRALFHQYCERLQSSIHSDPDAAVGAAKELLEAVAKHVLQVSGVDHGNLDYNALLKAAFRALALTREDISDTARGAKAMKQILSSFSGIVDGMRELRALYGTGHGRLGKSGLHPRHAKLAVGSAITLATFMLETVAARDISVGNLDQP